MFSPLLVKYQYQMYKARHIGFELHFIFRSLHWRTNGTPGYVATASGVWVASRCWGIPREEPSHP